MICSTLSRSACLALTVAWVQLAGAEPADAKGWVAEGNRQYQLAHFAEATTAYEKAYELSSAPAILYNLAQCHRMQGNFERAAFYYQRYLSTASKPIANEAMARQLLAEARAKAEQRARADEVALRAEQARRTAVEEVLKAEEARRRADAEVARFEDARRGVLALEEVRPAPPPPLTRRWWFWTALGVVAVGAGTAAAVVATRPSPQAPASLGDISF